MNEFLFQYNKVNPTTWVYLSSLLMIGLYFKFGRFWSVRNLDLVMLILLAPGLLMAQYGAEAGVKARRLAAIEYRQKLEQERSSPPERTDLPSEAPVADSFAPGVVELEPESPLLPDAEDLATAPPDQTGELGDLANGNANDAAEDTNATSEVVSTPARELMDKSRSIETLGYYWLFSVGALLLVRMLLDPTMVRRPLLEPNLTSGGLTFLGISLFIFLMANVWVSEPLKLESLDAATLERLAETHGSLENTGSAIRRGPGYALLNLLPTIPTNPLVPEGAGTVTEDKSGLVTAKVIAILCQLAVMLGIVAIGYWHFGSTRTGIGVATLYLMMPYTAQMTGHIDHLIPAAVLVWAVLCYRRPLTAGMFIGLATSLVYYPLFLLPLWISFYWRKGLMRFLTGVVTTLVLMAFLLYLIPEASYLENLQQMFGLWLPAREGLAGIWRLAWNPVYRIPVLAAFVAMCGTLAIWPAQKNLGTLLSCSAAVMIATQFWHGYGGGLYIAWYLPLMLLTIFRPNLEDRVALAVLGEGWLPRRVAAVANGFKAA